MSEDVMIDTLYEDSLPFLKSLILRPDTDRNNFPPVDDEDYEGLYHLEHLGDMYFSARTNFPNLTYILRYCVDGYEVFVY